MLVRDALLFARVAAALIGVLITSVEALTEDAFTSPFSPTALLQGTQANPALLAAPLHLTSAIKLFSVNSSMGNDKVVIPDPLMLLTGSVSAESWIARLLIESFDLSGMTPGEVSTAITDQLSEGIRAYGELSLCLPGYAHQREGDDFSSGIGIDAKICTKGLVHVPGGFFALIFSPTQGLQPGNTISFSNGFAQTECATVIRLAYGRTLRWKPPWFFLARGTLSWGAGVQYYLGHLFWQLAMDEGNINFSNANNLSLNGTGRILASDGFDELFVKGLPIKGHGAGVFGGVCLQYPHTVFSLHLSDIGAMRWNPGLLKTTFDIHKDSLYALTMLIGKSFPGVGVSRSTTQQPYWENLVPQLIAAASCRFDATDHSDDYLMGWSTYRIMTLGIAQSFARQVRANKFPALLCEVENGFCKGTFAVHAGWILNGSEKITSFLQFQVIGKELTYSLAYRTPGDGLFRMRKGFNIGIGTRIMWDY